MRRRRRWRADDALLQVSRLRRAAASRKKLSAMAWRLVQYLRHRRDPHSLVVGRAGAPYISDWLEHDSSSFVCWHGGMCPTCLTSVAGDGGGPRIRPHFNNKKPAVVSARVPINQCVGRITRAPVKFQGFRTGGRNAEAWHGCNCLPVLGLRRKLSCHDLQRPVEARETPTVRK